MQAESVLELIDNTLSDETLTSDQKIEAIQRAMLQYDEYASWGNDR